MATSSSSLLAFAGQRCPRCHHGRVFKTSALNLAHFQDMHEACPVCYQHYEPEPGFYWGAMYISYTFSVAIVVGVGIATYVLGHDPDAWVYVTAVTIATVLFMPLSFRFSRLVMLHLFAGIDYDPAVEARVTGHSVRRHPAARPAAAEQ